MYCYIWVYHHSSKKNTHFESAYGRLGLQGMQGKQCWWIQEFGHFWGGVQIFPHAWSTDRDKLVWFWQNPSPLGVAACSNLDLSCFWCAHQVWRLPDNFTFQGYNYKRRQEPILENQDTHQMTEFCTGMVLHPRRHVELYSLMATRLCRDLWGSGFPRMMTHQWTSCTVPPWWHS